MGTLLFWLTWAVVAAFYTVTTRKQRQQWFWTVWLLAIGSILTASILNASNQGYVTYL
jgi:hypothetical protein